MAGSKSDWLENAILDHILGKSVTLLSTGNYGTVHVGLWNSTMNDTFTGASTGEVASTDYARVAVTNSSNSWTNSTAGSKTNKIEISFTTAASSGWGTIKSAAICSSSGSSGHIFYYGDLTANQVVSTGNTVKFTTGSLVIGEA